MIVGITGRIGSGKDTIAEYLIDNYGYQRMSYASTLKDAVAAIFHWDRTMLEGDTKESRVQREQVDEWWAKRLNIPHLTPRWVLQYFGTDVCRKAFHDDIWIASLENKLSRMGENVVISDCRFPNEFYSLKRLGATTLRVERGEKPKWHMAAVIVSKGEKHPMYSGSLKYLEEQGVHASEYSSIGLEYDYTIDNNGTLDELFEKVDSIIHL